MMPLLDPSAHAIDAFFFSLPLRLYTLRVAILAALVALFTSIGVNESGILHGLWPALLSIVIVHHIITARSLPVFPSALDLSLTIAETVGSVFYARRLPKVQPYDPEIFVYHAVASWTMLGCLAMLMVFRIATIAKSRGKKLLHMGCDFLEQEERPRIIRYGIEESNPNHIKMYEVFLGRSFWKPRFEGEAKFVKTLRGFLGLIFTLFLIFFAMIHLVFEPIRETALTPVQEHRTTLIPPDQNIAQGLWNVMIPLLQNDTIGSIMAQNAFTVIPSPNNAVPPGIQQGCNTVLPPVPTGSKQDNFTAVSYQCFTTALDSRGLPEIPRSITIAVNFTRLILDFGLTQHIPLFLDPLGPSVTIVVAMANQTETGVQTLLEKTMPVSIGSRTNLVGAVSKDVRETFTSPNLAALGLYQITSSFWIPRFTNFYQDSLITPVTEISTLRLYIPLFQESVSELSIVSDIRTNSVLSGFSTFGGLWTALSGTFALIFGGSLLHFLRGSKNISLLGLAHSMQHDRERMRQHCLEKYPELLQENNNRGLLALIRDYVIDISFLDFHKPQEVDVERQSEPTFGRQLESPDLGSTEK